VLLGPWAGAVVVAAVLIVQCFLFNDGGLTALGANFINMGLIGAVGGYFLYAPIRRGIAGPKGTLIAAMAAAWFSVLLASGAFAIELAASGHRRDFLRILSWMALVHSLIGIGEALITGIVVRFVLLRRPDLLEPETGLAADPAPAGRWAQTLVAGLGVALGVAVFLAPFACESPDGLEYVGQNLGFLPDEAAAPPPFPSPMADYRLKVPGLDHAAVATALAGAVGTVVVFGLGWGMARILPQAKCEGATLDAA
jgi:cobalt/nickel transport system permease protein